MQLFAAWNYTMKKIKFLIKLKKEGKLEIVEPSEEVSQSYLQKSNSHLDAAKILFASNKLEDAVSMAYYGMYHSLLALLFKCGIKSENHTGSIMLLKELFNEDNLAKDITFGKKERIDKQYYMIKKAENFIVELKKIIKQLNEEKTAKLIFELNSILNLKNIQNDKKK